MVVVASSRSDVGGPAADLHRATAVRYKVSLAQARVSDDSNTGGQTISDDFVCTF